MVDAVPPLDLDATIVVRLRPGLAVACLLGAVMLVGLFALTGWGLLSGRVAPVTEWEPITYAWAAVSVFGMLFFIYAAAAWVRLLATSSQPVLVITPAGLLDRRLSDKLVPWGAITRIAEASSRGFLVGARVGIDRQAWSRMRLAWPFLARVVTVSAVATNIDARSLCAVLIAYWNAHKGKMESANV